MKLLITATTCFLLTLSALGATKDDPSITVTGEVAQRVPADRAYVVLYSEEDSSKSETALSGALGDLENVMDSIKIKSNKKSSYDIVNTGTTQSGDDYVSAYCIRISCAPEDEHIFKLIDDATQTYLTVSPSSAVDTTLPYQPIIYAVEKYETIETDLQTLALEDAKKRAEALAKLAGKTIGEIISIDADLIPADGRDLDLPTPYISDDRNGVMMVQTITVSYQLLSGE